MSEFERENGSDGFDDIADINLASYDDGMDFAAEACADTEDAKAYHDESAKAVDNNAAAQNDIEAQSDEQDYDEADFSDADDGDWDGLSEEESAAAAEFNAMDNVINGKKRKERKKKKKMSKRGKMIEYVAIACVCVALLSVLAYFASMLLGSDTKTMGLTGADVLVDMTDSDFYFGTVGTVDLTKTFPGGSGFAFGESDLPATSLRGNNLTIPADSGVETFELTYNLASAEEGGAATQMTVVGRIVEGGVNITTWDAFRSNASLENVMVLQDNIASPELVGLKRKDHPAITLRNDLYGNGKVVNVFELVCSRTKVNSKKFGEPYLPGNGKVGGDDGISIKNKTEDPSIPVLVQDVHFTGNDMSQKDAVIDEATGAVITPKGNMFGCSDATIASRGVLLFSRYGSVVNISGGYEGDDKTNASIKHCVIENGGKVVHIKNSNVDIEGSIVRNAADTAISVATNASQGSTIRSKNNVVANSLTGGILFYCFDGSIDEGNAEETWNHLYIDGFLDIYNWKAQNNLAFLPETEDFANIANPIAASEIPKKDYDTLKGKDEEGNLYIHFAIIKIRTGGGLPRNDSEVHGYENIGYHTCREIGFSNGFPIPSIASAIMKDIDVWGYYGKSDGDVTPTKVLGGKTEDDLKLFYKELREGRQPAAEAASAK